MPGKHQSSDNIWLILIKILILVFALYIAFLVLRPLLNVLLGLSFWLIKILVFITVAFFVIHLFLKLLFGIDLINLLLGQRWNR